MNTRSQSTIEYVVIVAVVAIAAIVAVMLYMHGSTSTVVGNQNAVLNAEYFVSTNGQNICNPTNPFVEYYTSYYGFDYDTSCIVFVTEKPLPPMANYTVQQVQQSGGNIENNDKYTLSVQSNQYFINYYDGLQNSIGYSYDNAGDFSYLGTVDGYYEYMMYMYGWKPLYNQFNLKDIELQRYTPNISVSYTTPPSPPSNTTDILPVKNNLIVPVIYTNQTIGPIAVSGSFNSAQIVSNNATIVVSGLPSGSSTRLNYQYYNSTSGLVNVSKTLSITSNPQAITVNGILSGLTYTASVSTDVSYNGISYYVAPNSSTYGSGSQVDFNYYTLSTGSLEYKMNKPLVDGAQVYFALPNSTFYYSSDPYSNLEFTVGNTLANDGTPIYAFISNYSYGYVVVNLGKIPDNSINTVYLNFIPPNGISNGDTYFSPEYSNGKTLSPPPSGAGGIFSSYNDNGGQGFWANYLDSSSIYSYDFGSATSNTYYIIGINEFLQSVTSFGLNTTNFIGTSDGAQAPFFGVYDTGSSGLIMFDAAYPCGSSVIYPTVETFSCPSGTYGDEEYYTGPTTISYDASTGTFYTELGTPNTFTSYTNNTIQGISDVSLFSQYNSGVGIVYYFATSNNNILDYTSTYEGKVS